jgi:mRNA interferase MazF
VRRGEIWWVDFGTPRGSEPGYYRPAIIVSSNDFNVTALRTVMIVPVYSNMKLGVRPGNVTIPAQGTGLAHASVANVTQVFAADRTYLDNKIGNVPAGLMSLLDDGLRLALSL